MCLYLLEVGWGLYCNSCVCIYLGGGYIATHVSVFMGVGGGGGILQLLHLYLPLGGGGYIATHVSVFTGRSITTPMSVFTWGWGGGSILQPMCLHVYLVCSPWSCLTARVSLCVLWQIQSYNFMANTLWWSWASVQASVCVCVSVDQNFVK